MTSIELATIIDSFSDGRQLCLPDASRWTVTEPQSLAVVLIWK